MIKKKKYKTSFYYSIKKNDSKHDHLTFFLNKGFKLIYNDVRKFGFIKIFRSQSINTCNHLKYLGPEPLTKKFNVSYVNNYFLNKKLKIKNLLMDQKFIAGLGNIYCNEILFLSKINPNRIVNKINKKELIKIVRFTKEISKKSISQGGSSIKDFVNTEGQNGNFQQIFNVYNRKKEKCKTKNVRLTDQRRIIAEVMSAATDHPDVDELHKRVNKIDKKISIATVYRTVKLFEESGIVEKHDFKGGKARYEESPEEHHDHLIDINSGEIIEFVDKEIEILQNKVAEKLGYKLVDHKLELYGSKIKK